MEIKDLKYTYKNTKNEVLKNITCSIKSGEITCIIGKNGSGKTTLLELISNLRTPTEGTITYDNFTISKTSEIINKDFWFEVSYNTNNLENFLDTTIKDNFTLRLKQYNYNNLKIKERILNSLKMLGLDESYLDRNILELSSGEKIRVEISYSLLLNPKIIILDNPTITLDEEGIKTLIKILKTLKRRYNKTIIIGTNDIEFVHKIADEIFVLNKGQIVLKGDKYEIFKQEDKLKKYGIIPPKTILFSNKVLKEKNIKIGYRDEINDLIKDIYRYVK